jgi:hypothetical protein
MLEAAASSIFFPETIELVFEKNTSWKSQFHCEERLILFHLGLFTKFEETQVSLERKPSVLEAGASSNSFPVRIDLVFERSTSSKSDFKRCKSSLFVLNMFIEVS